MTMIKKQSRANDYYSDLNHVIIGYDGTGDFLLKICDRSDCHKYAIIHGKQEFEDLMHLLMDAMDDFRKQEFGDAT